MLRGVIFDMDGVLLDNLSFHLAAWRQLGRELGRSLSDQDIRGVFGQRNLEMLTSLIGLHFDEEEAQRHAERKEQLYRMMIRPRLLETMVPGLLGFLEDLNLAGLQVGLATSGPLENAQFVLNGLGIGSRFQAVVTGDDVTRSKPDPEIFLLAAKRLKLRPQQCVVFEDSLAGVQAALEARCLCVALTTTHNRLELNALNTHHVIANFKALSVDMLREIHTAREASLHPSSTRKSVSSAEPKKQARRTVFKPARRAKRTQRKRRLTRKPGSSERRGRK